MNSMQKLAEDTLALVHGPGPMKTMCDLQMAAVKKMREDKINGIDKVFKEQFILPLNNYMGQYREINVRHASLPSPLRSTHWTQSPLLIEQLFLAQFQSYYPFRTASSSAIVVVRSSTSSVTLRRSRPGRATLDLAELRREWKPPRVRFSKLSF